MNRKTLRARFRQKRQMLSLSEQEKAACALMESFCSSEWFTAFQRFAVYMANDGEVNPAPIVERLWLAQKTCYLPVLTGVGSNRILEFKSYQPDTKLAPNHFGILEPQTSEDIRVTELDIVFTPLVAFDPYGNRLGMGGGYYDKTFQNLSSPHKKPYLIGLAYEFQKLDYLQNEPWDVPLEGVFTEKKFYPRLKNPCIP